MTTRTTVEIGGVATIDRDFSCPICLSIMRNVTATECLHRFCTDCIETAIRLGKNKECPSCRMPVATRRALRRDENFESLLFTLYPNGGDSVDAFQAKCLLSEGGKTVISPSSPSLPRTVHHPRGGDGAYWFSTVDGKDKFAYPAPREQLIALGKYSTGASQTVQFLCKVRGKGREREKTASKRCFRLHLQIVSRLPLFFVDPLLLQSQGAIAWSTGGGTAHSLHIKFRIQ